MTSTISFLSIAQPDHREPIFSEVLDVREWATYSHEKFILCTLRLGESKARVAIHESLIGVDTPEIGNYIHVKLAGDRNQIKPNFNLPEFGGHFYLVKEYQKKEGELVTLQSTVNKRKFRR